MCSTTVLIERLGGELETVPTLLGQARNLRGTKQCQCYLLCRYVRTLVDLGVAVEDFEPLIKTLATTALFKFYHAGNVPRPCSNLNGERFTINSKISIARRSAGGQARGNCVFMQWLARKTHLHQAVYQIGEKQFFRTLTGE